MNYSTRKLHAQKGTGMARVGDRGSPIRHDGGRALAKDAPNQYKTELPKNVYNKAIRIALSDAYKKGKIFLFENELDFPNDDYLITKFFLKKHELQNEKLLFITNKLRKNLLKSSEKYNKKIDISQKELIKVKDLLKADKIFIEFNALKFFEEKYGEKQAILEQNLLNEFKEKDDITEQELNEKLQQEDESKQ